MAGNSLFVAYIDFSTIRYSQFLFENLARKANSKVKIDAWMLKKFYAGFALIAILGLINFILMIIQFFVEWLHHSLVISISFVNVLQKGGYWFRDPKIFKFLPCRYRKS